MLFDLRALGYFVAAYEERSITAAARRCFVAQPSISMAIKGLEDVLEAALFERGRQGLTPTAAAHRLYPRACSLLADSSALLQDFRGGARERISLHVQDALLLAQLQPLLDELARQRPDWLLHLGADASQARLRVISEHFRRDAEVFQPLWQEPYVMLVPAGHPLQFRKAFALPDLRDAPLIEWPHCPLHQSFLKLAAEQGVVLRISASASHEELLWRMVDAGLGLAVVPQSHAAQARHAVSRPLQGALAFGRRLGLACAASDAALLSLLAPLAAALASPAEAAGSRAA